MARSAVPDSTSGCDGPRLGIAAQLIQRTKRFVYFPDLTVYNIGWRFLGKWISTCCRTLQTEHGVDRQLQVYSTVHHTKLGARRKVSINPMYLVCYLKHKWDLRCRVVRFSVWMSDYVTMYRIGCSLWTNILSVFLSCYWLLFWSDT